MQQPLVVKSKLSMQDLIIADRVSQSIKAKALAEKPIWAICSYVNTPQEDCVMQDVLMFHLTLDEAEKKTEQLNRALGHKSEQENYGSFQLCAPDAVYCMYDVWEQWEGQHLK